MARIKEYIKENIFFIISIFFYILITLPIMLNHIPWYDEAHAYMQAYFMDFHNWIDIVKLEGHPLLWFLIIMPFAKLNWHYPYPMLIINYVTCLVTICILWLYSPFNKWLKLAITFSSMFVVYFPIVARGYTLGVLFLFLLSALYKNKLKHPLLYPVLVGLTLNLNIISGIGASWFGLIYFIELLKSNLNIKTKIASSSILVFSTLFFIFPFIGGFGSEASNELYTISSRLNNLKVFFLYPLTRITIYTASCILILIKTHFCKELTILIYTDLMLLCLFAFFYPGGPHHFIFIFIYIIIFLWIYIDKYSQEQDVPCKSSKIDFLSIIIILMFLVPLPHNMSNTAYGHKMHAKLLIEELKTADKFRNSRLFLYEREALIMPYLINTDIEFYNACNAKRIGWDMFDTHNCISGNLLNQKLQDKNKNSFLINYPDINSKQFEKDFKIIEFPKEDSSDLSPQR